MAGHPRLEGLFLTGADGRFRWESAPPDPMTFGIQKRYYDDNPLGPDLTGQAGGEVSFTLEPAMEFVGAVRDAETGKRIDRPTVEVGRFDDEAGAVTWAEQKIRYADLLARVLIQGADRIALRVSAPGYAPVESEPFEAGRRLVTFDAELSAATEEPEPAGPPITGVVRRPDGTPMAGATVAISTRIPPIRVTLDEGEILYPSEQMKTAQTDAEGRFSLPAPDEPVALPPSIEPFALIAFDDEYFAEATPEQLKASPELTAQPWGRIEGRLLLGTEPASGFEMRLFSYGIRSGLIFNSSNAETDAEGRFTFRRVLSGTASLSWRPGFRGGPGRFPERSDRPRRGWPGDPGHPRRHRPPGRRQGRSPRGVRPLARLRRRGARVEPRAESAPV